MKISLLDIISLIIVILIGWWSWQCVLGMFIGIVMFGATIDLDDDDPRNDRDRDE